MKVEGEKKDASQKGPRDATWQAQKKNARKTGSEFYLINIRWQRKILGTQEEKQRVYMNGDDRDI